MPTNEARERAGRAFDAWMARFDGAPPYSDPLTTTSRQAHCARELARTAFYAGWEAREDQNGD